VAGVRRFSRILEIGCNDLYLLNNIKDIGDEFYGLDPIWIGQDIVSKDGINVIGKFVEQFDVNSDCGSAPELILSAHTFEHLESPFDSLSHLMRSADPECLFVIEVPGFESSMKNTRFDHVFHQHLQYYSLHSLLGMVESLGGKYVNHTYNYGYWGGTLILAFAFQNSSLWGGERPRTLPLSYDYLKQQFKRFRTQLSSSAQLLVPVHKDKTTRIVGYGAAQMLPSLLYHLPLERDLIEVIWDDSAERDGLCYPTYPFLIRKTQPDLTLAGSHVIVTALDSARVIIRRCIELNAERIVVPIQTF